MFSPFLSVTIQPQIRPPTPSAARSSPVKTPTTPDASAALDVSIFSILAWA